MTMTGLSAAPSRREVLGAIAAAGAAATLPGDASAAGPKHKGVIDLHHHFWAPDYLKAQNAWGNEHHVPPYPSMNSWTPEVSLAEMDKWGVQTAVVSLASISAGFWGLDGPAADKVVRSAIDYGTKMISDHKGRFGLFAPLCMIDVDLSLKEIEYGLDQAHADGIGIQTSYNGKYPGDPSYKPILEELNRRKTVVFLHGPNPSCCSAIQVGPGVNPSVVEVTFDTTRAALSLLASGSLVRYPDIQWILPYGGGTLPFVAGRIEAMLNASMRAAVKPEEVAPKGVFDAFGKLHYDTVNVTNAAAWAALTKLAKPTQIVYGTDFIYFHDDQLDNIDMRVTNAKDKEMILSGNAKRLMPRLAKA